VKADELKHRREMLGMTQQRFAERLGLARRTVQYYESGELDIPRTVQLALQALELEYK
jgi:transcriptional regulator with XRE-family HTH domain